MIVEKPEGVVLDLIVRPKKNFFAASFDRAQETLQIDLKSSPVKGQANRELEKALKKLFRCPVVLTKGLKAKRKQALLKGKKAVEVRAFLESL